MYFRLIKNYLETKISDIVYSKDKIKKITNFFVKIDSSEYKSALRFKKKGRKSFIGKSIS
jgi:hypothetical protein